MLLKDDATARLYTRRLLFSLPVLAQTAPGAADILKKVANTYSSLTQWAGMLSYFEAVLLAYQVGAAGATDARLLREEVIEIGSTKADCYVIQFRGVRPRSVFTWWVDKRRFVVLREDQADGTDSSFVGSSTIWTSTQTNGIPDDLFIFTPPTGAKQQAAP